MINNKKRVGILVVLALTAVITIMALYSGCIHGINETIKITLGEFWVALGTISLAYFTYYLAVTEGDEGKKNRELDKKRHLIEDVRNELEKAYGPLYTLFNPIGRDIRINEEIEWKDQKVYVLNINRREKIKLDKILSNFPFMFKQEIFTFWREFLQNPSSELEPKGEDITKIPERFMSMINDEYDNRVKKYNSLVGKESKK